LWQVFYSREACNCVSGQEGGDEDEADTVIWLGSNPDEQGQITP